MSSLFPLLPLLFALLATPVHAAPPIVAIPDVESFGGLTIGEDPARYWYQYTEAGGAPSPEVSNDADCNDGQCFRAESDQYANFDTGGGNFDACIFGASFGGMFRVPDTAYLSTGGTSEPVIAAVSDHYNRHSTDDQGMFSAYTGQPTLSYLSLSLAGHGASPVPYTIHYKTQAGTHAVVQHDPDTNLIAGEWYRVEADVTCGTDGSIHYTIIDLAETVIDDYTFAACISSCPTYTSLNTLHLGMVASAASVSSSDANGPVSYDDLFASQVYGASDAISAATDRTGTGLAANYAYDATVWAKDEGSGGDAANGRLYKYNADLSTETDFSPCGAAGSRYAANANEPIAYSDAHLLFPCRKSSNDFASIVWVDEASAFGDVNVINIQDDRGCAIDSTSSCGFGGAFDRFGDHFTHIVVFRAYDRFQAYAIADSGTAGCDDSGSSVLFIDVLRNRQCDGDAEPPRFNVQDLYMDKKERAYTLFAVQFNDTASYFAAPSTTPHTSPYTCLNSTWSNWTLSPAGLPGLPAQAGRIYNNREYAFVHADNGTLGIVKYGICGTGSVDSFGFPRTYAISFLNLTNAMPEIAPGHPTLNDGPSRVEMEISPDGEYIVLQTTTPHGMVLRLYDTDTLTLLRKLGIASTYTSQAEYPMAVQQANNYLYVLSSDNNVYRFPLFAYTVSTSGDGADEDTPNPPALNSTIPAALDTSNSNDTGESSGTSTTSIPPGGTAGPLHDAIAFCSSAWGFDCAVLFGLALIALIVMAFASYSTGSIVMMIATMLGFVVGFMLGLFPLWVLILVFFLGAGFAGHALFGGPRGGDE